MSDALPAGFTDRGDGTFTGPDGNIYKRRGDGSWEWDIGGSLWNNIATGWQDMWGATDAAKTKVESSQIQADADYAAIDAMKQASADAIAAQKEQFDKIQSILKPFVDAGNTALTQQNNLSGLNGPEAQAKAINALESRPEFQGLVNNGEQAMLANASATGGLRGGNLQGALAQFRPQMLSQLINDQYNRLGGITQLGANAAAGQAGYFGQQGGSEASLINGLGQNSAPFMTDAAAALAGGKLGAYDSLNAVNPMPLALTALSAYLGKKGGF